jgi:hypothetical protein
LQSAWVGRLRQKLKRTPVIVVRPVLNRTAASVAMAPLTNLVEQTLARSPLVKVVSAPTSAPRVSPASDNEAKRGAASFCPDLLLAGWLLGANDSADATELQSFVLALSLVDIRTAEKVWIGEFRVRKLVESTAAGRAKITRLSPDAVVDLSGGFHDADAVALTRTAAQDLLGSRLAQERPPHRIRWGSLRNRTSLSINPLLFTLRLEGALLRSGKVRVLTCRDEMGDLRDLRSTMATSAPDVCPAAQSQELASTCLLAGSFFSLSEAPVRRYVLSLEALDPEGDGKKLWVSVKNLDKRVEAVPSKSRGTR